VGFSSGTLSLAGGWVETTTTKLAARAQAYHFGLGVHAIASASGCVNSPTGLAEILGNDFIVSLGCPPLGGGGTYHGGTAEEQAGTFMHELGHNFNLAHGAPKLILPSGPVPGDWGQNCKPNYISVMNYARQIPMPLGFLTGTDWSASYSSGVFSNMPLTENALNESVGLKSKDATTPKIVWGAINPTTSKIQIYTASSAAFGAASIPINWDNDGNTAETLAATSDINNFDGTKVPGCAATPYSSNMLSLKDYDDWNNLQYNFRNTAGATFLDGSHAAANKVPELTTSIAEGITDSLTESNLLWKIDGFYNPVDMHGVINTVKSGQSVPLKFEIFEGSTEKTSVSDVSSFTQKEVSCSILANTISDEVEITNTGSTSLKYDSASGQFQANWKTPSGKANTCWEVRITATNGPYITAFFKLK